MNTKPMTLYEQVKDAKKTVAQWSKEKRESVQLEGVPIGGEWWPEPIKEPAK